MTKGEGEPDSSTTEAVYFRAAKFARERAAFRAYTQAQELIYRTPCDLSAYRLQLSQVWQVAIVGLMPPEDLNRKLERILAVGEAAVLPDAVVKMLHERGVEMRRQGPWSEGHYRPGRRP